MSRFPRRVELAAALVAFGAAVLVWWVTRTYPNYDSYYHLVWGRELLNGSLPSLTAYAAPTQHPLYIVVAAVLGLVFGESGDRALVLLCFLAHAALVLGTYRLGAAVFGRWSGALAALFVAASASFLLYAARGYVDPPFLALVVWAGVLAAEDRRGVPVLLVLAGLLRPEAWVLTGLWWLWKRRLRDLPIVFIAPVIWSLTDLIVTGNPIHSIQSTSALAEDLGRVRGIQHVPGSFVTFIGSTVRPPVALLAPIGAYLAWRYLGWRRLLVPGALLVGGIVTFVGTGVLGLSILPRYLTVPAIAMCLFAGYALLGFTEAEGRVRALWLRVSAGAAVVGAIGMLILAPSLTNVTEEMRFIRATHDSLVALLDDPEVRAGMRCGTLTFPTYRLVPDAKWHLEDGSIGARSALRRDRGVEVFALSQKALRRYGFADGTNPKVNLPNPAFQRVASAGIFAAYVRCP
jgi:hypothetical protein